MLLEINVTAKEKQIDFDNPDIPTVKFFRERVTIHVFLLTNVVLLVPLTSI